jgi:hypothetical protein
LSRKRSQLNSFGKLAEELPRYSSLTTRFWTVKSQLPDETGRTVFGDLMYHRAKARFYAFDLLQCNGEDLRSAIADTQATAQETYTDRLSLDLLCGPCAPVWQRSCIVWRASMI